MTRQQAEQFFNAYNMLLTIATRGEDTRTMANVLSILEQLANSIQLIEEQPMPVFDDEPEEVEDIHIAEEE